MAEAKTAQFVERAVGDVAAVLGGAMVVIGDRLGLYRAMAGAGALTPAELAARTGTAERYVREWLSAQAAAGYVSYDGAGEGGGRFRLPDEHAAPLTDETSPDCVIGAFELAVGSVCATDAIAERFRTGDGFPWGAHNEHVLVGCERFFRPGYLNHLTRTWIPALDGVTAKLAAGARVADMGCGHGASTLLLAQAYPAAAVVGFDAHDGSIRTARKRAADAGLDGKVRFQTASVTTFEGTYDLVCFFDCLHDMGDPAGACARVLEHLAPDGTLMIVEPFAADGLVGNLNPVGAAYYGLSTLLCVPNSLTQEVGAALGAQAGEARLREIVVCAGFKSLRRVAETSFNIVLEAKA
ncbi:class I SAM-dependent methyltransferase [Catenulispora rubra]|uniref:class I SAM-dependent methyltransferase n=1 Tax=Catenulispora rubra TaxID=280293 RepID=UPI0018925761|nr:class I SAM-dependent methyltransferase [Catenulispora rubra]